MSENGNNAILALAPAAGTGIGKELAARLLRREDFMGLLEEAAVAALTAMQQQRWNPVAKQWEPSQPDARTRLGALLGLMAQLEGEPVRRIVHQHLGGGGVLDLHAVLRDSPELREVLARELQNAKGPGERSREHFASKRAAKAKKAAEVMVVDGGV
jgi:hypothetical protein